jgi:hypothetical protein
LTFAPISRRMVSNSVLSEMRPPVATLMTCPLALGASHALSTPSTTFATYVKSRVCSPSP